MDAYERSLKQQAERIRRELSQEGKKVAPTPKPKPSEEFVPSDVPSPIYGYARPKPKINLPIEDSPETRETLAIDSSEEDVARQEVNEGLKETSEVDAVIPDVAESIRNSSHVDDKEGVSEHLPDVPESEHISPETLGDNHLEAPVESKATLGEMSITNDGFASVFMESTDLKTSKIVVREEKEDVSSKDEVNEMTSIEKVGPAVENIAKTLQADAEDDVPLNEEAELTPAVSVSYKAESPPVNVLMTPQDRMAMYRNRRLAQKNTNL